MEPARKLEYTSPEPLRQKPIPPRLKKKARKKNPVLPPTFRVCLLAVFFVAICLTVVGQQVYLMRMSVSYERLVEERAFLLQKNGTLQVELNQARSLTTIEHIARNQLGMVKPHSAEILVLRTNQPVRPLSVSPIKKEEDSGGLFKKVATVLNRWFPLGGGQPEKMGP